MADRHRRRRMKSDDDSEGSFSESDGEGKGTNDTESSVKGTPEKFSRRRRRRVLSVDTLEEHSFSETDSELEDDAAILKNKRKDAISKLADGSEYESAEDEEEDKTTDKTNGESRFKDQESLSELVDEEGGEEDIAETEDVEGDFLSGDPPDDASEDGEYVEEERQQGDGEECAPSNTVLEKELDYDEDRRNPQYIPKKGIFYEHDDRNNEDPKEKEEEPLRDRKKKLWLDEGKWGHDRFCEEEQYPKSRHELIETYGYDIRNEDGPPRARRRRRYGRGPTKYERNWEDVTAYGRERFKGSPRGYSRGRRSRGRFRGASRFRGRGRGRYNSQNSNKSENESTSAVEDVTEGDSHKDTESKDSIPVINNKEFPALPAKEAECAVEPLPEREAYLEKNSPEIIENKSSVRTLTFENSNLSGRNSVERDIPPRRGKTSPFRGSHERGSRKPIPRGTRGSGRGEYSRRGRGNMRHISPRFLENKVNSLNSEMEHLSIEEVSNSCNDMNSEVLRPGETNGVLVNNLNGTEVSNIGLKGAGDSAGRPKRYSSLRQRSMPETTTYQTPQQPVPPPHAPYYDAGYQTALYAPSDTGVPTPSTQSQTVASPPIMNPSAYQTFAPTPYTDNYGIRLPVTTPPRLFPQVTVPAGQPILAPPPCITPSPSIMNFAPPPPPAGYHQFAYQQYATPPPPPPPAPPSDMFQTGITYYYPPSQPPPIRPTVQKRPKAAIPILPPPERETKKNDKQDSSQVSSNRNFSDSSSDPVNVEMSSLRTEPPTQMQTSVGVES